MNPLSIFFVVLVIAHAALSQEGGGEEEEKEKKPGYTIELTGLELLNGTMDDFFDYTNLVYNEETKMISGSVTLFNDFTDDMEEEEGLMQLVKKDPDTGEYRRMIAFGPDPFCELYNKRNPAMVMIKQVANLPEKCPLPQGTYTLDFSSFTEEPAEGGSGKSKMPEDLPRGEFAFECLLTRDNGEIIVSGVRAFFEIKDKPEE